MKKIAILTTFNEFMPGYSLTGLVADQARMLKAKGHKVTVFVSEKFNEKHPFPISGIEVREVIPSTDLIDYTTESAITDEHKEVAKLTRNVMVNHLKDYDIAFTHDYIYTGWNLPYCHGVLLAQNDLPNLKWFHWLHSVPSTSRDWWIANRYAGYGKIIFPNNSDRILVAEQFRGKPDDVRIIHHIKDLRSWFDFEDRTCKFIDRYPKVMQGDIVNIYPASCDRLGAKRVKFVIHIMGELKKKGCTVCFVVANQWATGKQRKEDIEAYKEYATAYGLEPGNDFIFTSEFGPEYELGLDKKMLYELMLCGNLLVFPTREESFGFVPLESSFCGNFVVTNKSLPSANEIMGGSSLSIDFGSNSHRYNLLDPLRYFKDCANLILRRMDENESTRTRTFLRQHYNWDYLYERQYAPLFAESKLWRLS